MISQVYVDCPQGDVYPSMQLGKVVWQGLCDIGWGFVTDREGVWQGVCDKLCGDN